MMHDELLGRAQEVLKYNDVGNWTRPAPDVYPHQWLWDSCFIAIGLSHYDVERAKKEILSLFRGQWSNGMLPHMIFSKDGNGLNGSGLWGSQESIYAPDAVQTSGITQPPMLAEAIVRIGKQLKASERREWYKTVWPHLIAYHEWLYRERNPHAEGLVILIHPWETGLDNTPPWMETMHAEQKPLWIKLVEITHFDAVLEHLRNDTRQVSPDERMSTIESLMLFSVVRRLRRKQYDINRILIRSHFIIEDVFYNAILIRANTLVGEIADEIGERIPSATLSYMNKASHAINDLWDDHDHTFYSRMFITRQPIKVASIESLMPLYSGVISKEKADLLVAQLKDPNRFATNYPVPSVPRNSPYFNHRRYWQGPTWLNTNWLIADGLERYGYLSEAHQIRQTSLDLVRKSGFSEYFSPLDGFAAGIAPFSWTAALTIDLLRHQTRSAK